MTCNDEHCECYEEAFEPEEGFFEDEEPDEYSRKQIVGITVDQSKLSFELPERVEYHVTQVSLGLNNTAISRHVLAISFGENPEETYVIARLIPNVIESVTIDVTIPASVVSQKVSYILNGEECGPVDVVGTLTYIAGEDKNASFSDEDFQEEKHEDENVDSAVKTLEQERDELLSEKKEQQKPQRTNVEPVEKAPQAEDATRTEAKKDNSKQFRAFKGIEICDDKIGTGRECKRGNQVVVTYVLRLTNEKGEILDQTKGNQKFEFKVGAGEVISGWDLGVPNMKVGGKRTLIIPPARGYGSKAVGPIPANSTLYFEVELHDVK